jgi:hypothetical protein|uniref:O-fucosyltransferase family protein n=1 Tax=Picea sitchensis TaxID=3332 RepID=B8LR49_PICSI|nr:unknown [Picea sitchensis]
MIDLKQAVAAFLTLGMLAMLINMMSNGPFLDADQASSEGKYSNGSELRERSPTVNRKTTRLKELWGRPGPVLEPCWDKHITNLKGKTWGFIGVRLSNGPHYHRVQIADAVVVSKYLGATLLIPTIKDGHKEPNGQFDKIYDTSKFIASLQNIVRVVGRIPDDMSSISPTVISVPYRVTHDYIDEHIRPVFNQKTVIILDSFFPNINLKAKEGENIELEALRCLVMYKAVQFHSQLLKLGGRIVNRMREAGEMSEGRFIAVDLRVDLLQRKGCTNSTSEHDKSKTKKCVTALEVGEFLKELGFPTDTAIYLTQSRWDATLDPLREIFPNVYTKEYSMPFNEERQILYSGKTQFEKALDFYICSQSDIFVPAISGMFYSTVAGQRISLGKTQILVPSSKHDTTSKIRLVDSLSRYVTKKDHSVYSCFC